MTDEKQDEHTDVIVAALLPIRGPIPGRRLGRAGQRRLTRLCAAIANESKQRYLAIVDDDHEAERRAAERLHRMQEERRALLDSTRYRIPTEHSAPRVRRVVLPFRTPRTRRRTARRSAAAATSTSSGDDSGPEPPPSLDAGRTAPGAV